MSTTSLIVSPFADPLFLTHGWTGTLNLKSIWDRGQLYIHPSPPAGKLFSCGRKPAELNVKELHHLQRAPSAAQGELHRVRGNESLPLFCKLPFLTTEKWSLKVPLEQPTDDAVEGKAHQDP